VPRFAFNRQKYLRNDLLNFKANKKIHFLLLSVILRNENMKTRERNENMKTSIIMRLN